MPYKLILVGIVITVAILTFMFVPLPYYNKDFCKGGVDQFGTPWIAGPDCTNWQFRSGLTLIKEMVEYSGEVCFEFAHDCPSLTETVKEYKILLLYNALFTLIFTSLLLFIIKKSRKHA